MLYVQRSSVCSVLLCLSFCVMFLFSFMSCPRCFFLLRSFCCCVLLLLFYVVTVPFCSFSFLVCIDIAFMFGLFSLSSVCVCLLSSLFRDC